MTRQGFGLSNWMEIELFKEKDEPGEKRKHLWAEDQAKTEKEWPVKCGTQKAGRVKSFQEKGMVIYIKC